jgi:HAD superfamily hydrolase (TIGR01509 family)
MRFSAAIFDLDGTLLDSTAMWEKIDELFFTKRGITMPVDYFDALGTMSVEQSALYTKERFALPDTPEAIAAEWHETALVEYRENVPLKPGAAELLRCFKAEGAKLALATASDPGYYIPALTRTGVYELFDVCVHSSPGFYKGNAAFYLKCAEELGVSPGECVVFEDVLDGVAAAKAAGMYAVGVYDQASDAKWDEICRVADVSVRGFDEYVFS